MKKKRVKKMWKSPDADPMGSYTGNVTDEDGNPLFERPVQDADDL